MKKKMYTKNELLAEFRNLHAKSVKYSYLLTMQDAFAIGYLVGKYNIRSLEDEKSLIKACNEYDETDDLGLLDTISEVFIDLE